MTRLGPEELARRTLRRQFPDLPGRGPDDVMALFDRLGPIQSQVPRAPFLAASSRLPGVAYDTVNGLFADHRLVKTSSLRGTVHTSTAATFPRLDAVARPLRATQARQLLALGRATAGGDVCRRSNGSAPMTGGRAPRSSTTSAAGWSNAVAARAPIPERRR